MKVISINKKANTNFGYTLRGCGKIQNLTEFRDFSASDVGV